MNSKIKELLDRFEELQKMQIQVLEFGLNGGMDIEKFSEYALGGVFDLGTLSAEMDEILKRVIVLMEIDKDKNGSPE